MGNISLPLDYVVIDFETTGFNPYNDKIIQVAAVKYHNHELVDQFVSYVNPERSIPDRITSLTGITNYRVSDAPTIEEVLPLFLAFLHTNVIVAHNASFDMRFLKSNVNMLGLPEPKNNVIDTVFLAKKYMKHAPNHKLETLKRMLGIRLSSHNAFDDCITCAAVYQKCAAVEEEGKRKANKEVLDETAVFEAVKEMLVRNKRDIEWIRCMNVGSYLDIKAFYPIIRLKVKGRKKYVLTEKMEDDVREICTSLTYEAALKSEIGNTRIMIDSVEDILKLESYIVAEYDSVLRALDEYRANKVNADEEIKKYLNTMV
ncbi:3'-5' exonuclease [Bacillus mycoides]|uniref:Exonuclease, DNA polymerase III, epsilon subunit n=2 Tax=Bacillus cereus group TaxID=86661 RepID=R8HYK0_BACCE|nr:MULTISPECIES: 3'-5' exonuclease [Bacillus]KXY27572.1 DNA polymerase III subunit epsilon [Bacillus cereus]RAN89948.1 DNA polymerase III subunit epsilon [Bacillus sp. SRB_28]AIW84002.1 DNA polymerase III alpha subunit [Bacillus mycoides]EOO77960.1 exonuclease, DNA polymerase III, epsilon subunit [Bacillus cereus VD021]MBK5428789.1 3'-5' exonuclease [Bacillus sp. TH30]